MAKNQLQEYYQNLTRETGNPHPLPAYKTVRVGGEDHIPLYVTTVTHGNMTMTGDPKSNKKAAEADAAQKAYQHLTTRKTSTTISSTRSPPTSDRVLPTAVQPSSGTPRTLLAPSLLDTPRKPVDPVIPAGQIITADPHSVILIDSENMPKIINQFLKYTRGFTIYLFVGEHHHDAEIEYPASVIKVLSPSTRKNGTDTCMQVYVGRFLERKMFSHYFIVTRDNFGAALVDMIVAPNMPWEQQNARIITSVNHL